MIMDICPLDVLLFRDARPFNTEQAVARSKKPTPATIAGAIRSKILIHNEMNERAKEFISYGDPDTAEKIDMKGVFFSYDGSEVFPVPLNVVRVKIENKEDSISMVEPLEILGHRYLGGEYLHYKPVDAMYISSSEFRNYLNGQSVDVLDKIRFHMDEERVGIKINPVKSTAEEGKLYRVSFLRLNEKVFLRVWFGRDDIKHFIPNKGFLKLGGENKSAHYELKSEKREMFGYSLSPDTLNKINEARRFKVYFATPYVFDDDFEEELKSEMERVLKTGLAVKGSASEVATLAGWDYRRGRHKEGKNILKEGSVVFFEMKSGKVPADFEYPLNLGLIRSLGFGCTFIGAW